MRRFYIMLSFIVINIFEKIEIHLFIDNNLGNLIKFIFF